MPGQWIKTMKAEAESQRTSLAVVKKPLSLAAKDQK